MYRGVATFLVALAALDYFYLDGKYLHSVQAVANSLLHFFLRWLAARKRRAFATEFATQLLGRGWQGNGHRNGHQLPRTVAPLIGRRSSVSFFVSCYGLEKQKAPLNTGASCSCGSSKAQTYPLATIVTNNRCLAFADWGRGRRRQHVSRECRQRPTSQGDLNRSTQHFILEGKDQL
jgi:hypothetical protein